MQPLVCEMCGGKDLIKRDGLFVCESCGVKYTLEEARKMMIEGTVKVDNTDRLNNLYVLARRAREDDNTADAAKYYAEIRLEDPNSWEAAFYGVLYKAMDCVIGQIESAANSITNCLSSSSDLILKYVPKEEQRDAYTDMILGAVAAGDVLYNGALNSYNSSTYDDRFKDFISRAGATLLLMCAAGKMAEDRFQDYELAEKVYLQCIKTANTCNDTRRFAEIPQQHMSKLGGKAKEAKRKRVKEYWDSHPEEKRDLDNQKEKLKEKERQLSIMIADIENNINSLPSKVIVDEYEGKINEKKRMMNSLGLFRGKEKKAIQSEIDDLMKLKSEAARQFEQDRFPYSSSLMPFENELNKVTGQISQIDDIIRNGRTN